MKSILVPTYRRIRRRIISFKKINLLDIEKSDLVKLINSSFTFPTGLFPQVPGGNPIYRACVNVNSVGEYINEPFTSKSRISFHPHPPKYGRCNLIDKPIFYGADGLDVAICETCNNILSKEKKELYLTIGEWKLTKELKVSVVCHSKRAHKRSGDLIQAYYGLVKLVRSKMNKSEFRIWRIKNRFFSDEFSKEVNNGFEKEYLFSALYANIVLNTNDTTLKASGIWYPSVAYRLYGHNVAYDTSLIDNGTLILSSVMHIKCTFTKLKGIPLIKIIASTDKINGDIIEWN